MTNREQRHVLGDVLEPVQKKDDTDEKQQMVVAGDRLERSPALDRTAIRISPAEPLAVLQEPRPPDEIRLNTFDGRPVYRIRMGRDERVVYADTGATRTEISTELMARVASAWTRQPAAAAAIEPIDVDQWTVQGSFRSLRPL